MMPTQGSAQQTVSSARIAAIIIAIAAFWSYFPMFQMLYELWNTNPNYSQGFLIPILAIGVLWYRCRDGTPEARPSVAFGLGLVALSVAMRGVAAYYFVNSLDNLSLLVLLAGITLLFGGWPWFGVVWPVIALLAFMFPIPPSIGGDDLVADLQEISTKGSTFALQLLGMTAMRDGNVILLKGTELGVVEACSGLRMLMVFCALCVVAATVIPTSWPRKVVILLCAVPLAILCNIIRITVAGLACKYLGDKTGHFIFHDLAGWLMVPMAFIMLGLVLFVMSKLFYTEAETA